MFILFVTDLFHVIGGRHCLVLTITSKNNTNAVSWTTYYVLSVFSSLLIMDINYVCEIQLQIKCNNVKVEFPGT